MADYFRDAPDPDRGYALAAIAGTLAVQRRQAAACSAIWCWNAWTRCCSAIPTTMSAISPRRYRSSGNRDVAANRARPDLSLGNVVTRLRCARPRRSAGASCARLLDRLDGSSRFAFLKLITGGLRIGVSARLVKQALAEMGNVDVDRDRNALARPRSRPMRRCFAGSTAGADKPELDMPAVFHAVMLATPVGDNDLASSTRRTMPPNGNGTASACSSPAWRHAQDLFPLRRRHIRRLSRISWNRSISTASSTASCWSAARCARNSADPNLFRPAATAEPQDRDRQDAGGISRLHPRLRPPFRRRGRTSAERSYVDRRERFRNDHRKAPHRPHFDLSPLVPFSSWEELDRLRAAPPDPVIEGMMLKRQRHALSVRPRSKGPWFKWKRDPYNVDAVLMYAQRGHGKRSSYYSDFTFGVWTEKRRRASPGAGRQGLFRLYRRRNWKCSTVTCATTPTNASVPSAPCGPSRITALSSKSPSRASTVPPGTNPAWPCGFRASPGFGPTSCRARPTGWKRCSR